MRLLHAGHADGGERLLDENPNPARENVVDAIGGSVTHYTVYEPIMMPSRRRRGDSRRRA